MLLSRQIIYILYQGIKYSYNSIVNNLVVVVVVVIFVLFYSSSSDKTVKIWDKEKMKCIHTFYEHQDQVWCAKYNPASTNIVSVSEDRTINIYECPPITN